MSLQSYPTHILADARHVNSSTTFTFLSPGHSGGGDGNEAARAGSTVASCSHGDLIVLERVPGLLLAERRDPDDAALAGQHGQAFGEELVHLAGHLTTLRDGPHDQRLAATTVCGAEGCDKVSGQPYGGN